MRRLSLLACVGVVGAWVGCGDTKVVPGGPDDNVAARVAADKALRKKLSKQRWGPGVSTSLRGEASLALRRLLSKQLWDPDVGVDVRAAAVTGRDSLLDARGADLRDADLSGEALRTDLRGADLRGANLKGAVLAGLDIVIGEPGHLTLSELTRRLPGADLSGADLRGADLSGANLFRVNFSGANLSLRAPPDSQRTRLRCGIS